MKVGDLVKYALANSDHIGVGVIIEKSRNHSCESGFVAKVMWPDGNIHSHAGRWLISIGQLAV